jgi:hypothetical protein
MSFVGPGQVVTYLYWKQNVQQLGLDNSSTPGTEEIRLFKEGSEYFLEIWTGTSWLKVSRNAELLNGQDDTFYRNAGNLNAGTIPLDRIPATLTGKSADQLDGQHGSYYQNASNLNTGTIPAARLGFWNDNESGETSSPFIQTGRVQGVASSPFTRTVTLSVAYSSTPQILVGNSDTDTAATTGHIIARSTTGFTFYGRYTANYFTWLAIGKKT